MADRIVKPDTGNNLVLQNDDASAKIEINEAGTVIATPSVQVDNIKIDGNAITSENTNGNIDLTPNGTGEVNISKVDIDSGTITGITDLAVADGGTGASNASDARTNLGVVNVPSNLVAYRASGASTPSGWSEYTSARGRMIVGLPSGGSDGGTVGSSGFTDQQNMSKDISHTHTSASHFHLLGVGSEPSEFIYKSGGMYGFATDGEREAYISPTASGGASSRRNFNSETKQPTATGGMSANNILNTADFLSYIQLMTIKKD